MDRAKIVINLKNIEYNIDKLLSYISKDKFMAVIKANAYGHGAIAVYNLCIKKGINWFGVATYKEAMQLRSKNKDTNILILGGVEKKYYNKLAQNNIHFTVTSFDEIEYIKDHKLNCQIHLAYDTGMGRIGFDNNNIEIAIKLSKPCGIFTHLSVADEDKKYSKMQIEKFNKTAFKYDIKYRHALNSYGSLHFAKDSNYDLYRIGIMLYGADDTKLFKQALSLYSRVSYVKKLDYDTYIGYGNTYLAKKEEYIATISLGYADGIKRGYSNRGRVYINGRYYKIVGNICMDQFMVSVDNNVKIDDEVEIIGDHISINEISQNCDTISYEILCSISKRANIKYEK